VYASGVISATDLRAAIDSAAADNDFSGVVRVDIDNGETIAAAYGLADRAWDIPNTVDTVFATASAAKGFTALAVMSLVEDGVLRLDTTARSLLGADLPMVGDDVTVEHLLSHTSGIGDYLDESSDGEITDYVLPVPPHTLAKAEHYLPILDGYPTVSKPGEVFAYNNSGYVLLAILAERASGVPFHELVAKRVLEPAGMTNSGFLRSDELPDNVARGYLDADGLRSNVLHLPVRGVGDGGLYTTAADLRAFWQALFSGKIVSKETVAEMVRRRNENTNDDCWYGLGFYTEEDGGPVWLEGYDAGVSMRSAYLPETGKGYTVISNWSNGAWPMIEAVEDLL